MIGLWLEDRHLRLRDDIPMPTTGPGEALVRVHLVGICATDLELARGYGELTGVIGHEFTGEILSAPDAPGRIGERVVGAINVGCGSCAACLAGQSKHCERRKVLGIRNLQGALAQCLALPLANLHRIPDGVSDECAVFCEPLAAALHIQAQRAIQPGEHVLLVGAGRLGQLIALTLAAAECSLSVVARHPRQKALLEAAGIPWLDETDVAARAFDLVVESSGSPSGFDLACRSLRPGGTLVLKSTYSDQVEVDLSRLVVDEVTLLGSRCGAFPPALDLLERGIVDPRPLIDARYPLAQAFDAFEHAARPGALKVLVECGATD